MKGLVRRVRQHSRSKRIYLTNHGTLRFNGLYFTCPGGCRYSAIQIVTRHPGVFAKALGFNSWHGVKKLLAELNPSEAIQ